MRSIIYLALSTLATLAVADDNAFNIPNGGYEFTAGESTTLTWDPTTSGTVTLKLQWGDILTPDSGTTIISNLPNSGSYTWTVPADIADRSDYTIEIISDSDSDDVNYLPRFEVTGATAVASSTVVSTTTTETTTTTTTTSTPTTTSTTTTKSKSSSSSTNTPTPTTSTTLTSSTTTASSTTTESTSTSTPTTVPDTNAGMTHGVSGGLIALAMGVAALF